MARRLLIAIACVVALVASFLLVSALLGGPRPGAPAPLPGFLAAVAPQGTAQPPAAADAPPPPPGSAAAAQPDAESRLHEAALAADMQEEAEREAIFGPAREPGLSVDERLARYREALRDALEGTPRDHLLEARGMLTEAFLRLEEVQQDLAAMSPGARQSAINGIRREMGYGDADIARLEEVDAWRNARWENGLAYMQERRRLTRTFEGDALAEELDALREEYFGHEAETIEAEEQSGFFRYERPRVYGRN